MDVNELIQRINTDRLKFISTAIISDQLFNSLVSELRDPKVKDALVSMLVSEGARSKTNSEAYSILFSILNDALSANKLVELITSKDGMEILKRAVDNNEGETLVLGAMHANYAVAHAFVNKLLQKKEGRKLAVALVSIAASHYENFTCSTLPPLTNEGKKLQLMFHDISKLENAILDKNASEQLIYRLTNNEIESVSIIASALCDETFLNKLVKVLRTEKGREFCSLIGKCGFGRKFGAGKIWLTKGGRAFVHEMMKTEEGVYAIYAIMTGMSVGEFIAYTVKLDK